MNHTLSIPALLLASTCSAQTTQEFPLRILIDHNLDRSVVQLVALNADQITVQDQSGTQIALDSHDYVALAPTGQWHNSKLNPELLTRGPITSRSGVVTLSDGQRILGTPSISRVGEEFLAWLNPRLGTVSIPIESISQIVMPRLMPTSDIATLLMPTDDDVIRLNNGDTLKGFIESIGIITTIELADGSTLTTDTASIDQITLANETTHAAGTHIWLADGSVLGIQNLIFQSAADDQTIVLGILNASPIVSVIDERTPSEADDAALGLSMGFELNAVHAISFDAGTLVPLARLQAITSDRDLVIDTASVAALGCTNILMPGPMTATWDLPTRADRLSLTAEIPFEALDWGNLELIVLTDGTEHSRHALSADNPQAHIKLDLAGNKSFTLEINEGQFGPIQDRLVLSEAIVLLSQ